MAEINVVPKEIEIPASAPGGVKSSGLSQKVEISTTDLEQRKLSARQLVRRHFASPIKHAVGLIRKIQGESPQASAELKEAEAIQKEFDALVAEEPENASNDGILEDQVVSEDGNKDILKDGQQYGESAKAEREMGKALKYREIVIKEMEETGELLDRNHPLYEVINRICLRLKPEAKPDVNLSLSDSPKAFTLQDKRTIVLSANLLTELEAYLQTKGKQLSEDHIALILGHEMSHWDDQAKISHISERYCDTKGLELCNKAGFSIDSAVEALEFLEFIEEKAKHESNPDDESGTSVSEGEISHPTSEDRRILIQSIVNDPNIDFEGRYIKPTVLAQDTYGDFKQKAEQWLEQVRRREMISSTEDVQREFGSARSLSQVVETFLSADEYYHANMSREFAQTDEFGNLLLAMAAYGEITNTDFRLLDKEDFKAQFRAGLIADSGHKIDSQSTQSKSSQFSTKTNITSEQLQLIQDCIDGKFKDPLKILTAPKPDLEISHPQFVGFTFNNFFNGIGVQINQFIQPEAMGAVKESQNLGRARILGLQGKLNIAEYIADEANGVTAPICKERSILLGNVQYSLASSLLRFSHSENTLNITKWDDFAETSQELVRDFAAFGPDYNLLQSQVAQGLIDAKACSTQTVADKVSKMILRNGRYLSLYEESEGVLAQLAPQLEDTWIDTLETHRDLRTTLYDAHLGLTQGGQELGRIFSRPRIDGFIRSLNYNVRAYRALDNDPLDFYDILINGEPTISIPFQDIFLDRKGENIDLIRAMDDSYLYSGRMYESIKCQTSDPEIIRRLILESAPDTNTGFGRERRSRIIDAVLNNRKIQADVPLIRSILQEGVATKSLTQRELDQILYGIGDLSLYEEFKSYLEEDRLGNYHQLLFDSFRQKLEVQNVPLPEIIARFVEDGGVIQGTGSSTDSQYGALIIPTDGSNELGKNWFASSKSYPEHPDFSFTGATNLASRIMAYTQTSGFPHSEEVKQVLLDNAAVLMRYSQKLSTTLGYGFDAYALEGAGEGVGSLDDLTERINKMPVSRYRDKCVESVVLMLLNPDSGFRKQTPISLEQVKILFRMYSPDRLRYFDPESKDNRFVVYAKPFQTLPLEAGSFDIREMYPFRYGSNDVFLRSLGQFADMLDGEFDVASIQDANVRLNQARDSIPYPSSPRDYLLERALFPVLRGDEQFAQITTTEKLSMLQTAYEASYTVRTKGSLGRQIAEIRLGEIGDALTFDNGIKVILETMPERSTTRDYLIQRVLNTTYTTWDQINQAELLLLGDEYQTDETASAARSSINEAIFRKVQEMSIEERDELIFFLLDRTKHVLKPDDLTEGFFDNKVLAKLKLHSVGEYERRQISYANYLPVYDSVYRKVPNDQRINAASYTHKFSEEDYDQVGERLPLYLFKRYRGEDVSQLRAEMGDIWGYNAEYKLSIIDQIEFAEVLQMAIPDSLSDFIQQQLGDVRGGRKISATSLGPMFITYNPEDRRQLLYRLCLGNNGFFEDKNFATYGTKILEGFIDLSTREIIPAVGEEQVSRQWSSQELATAKKVITTAFEALDSRRRAEVFSRIINLVVDSGGSVSKEQIIKTTLTAFGVVGAKVGQMDQLLPDYLRDGLGSLKEQVPPIPKTTVSQVMKRSGRDQFYDGLGSSIGAASTATVYLARRKGSSEEDRVIKVLRPDALKYVDSDLNAVQSVVATLRDSGTLSVDPTQIIEEMKTMITEEFNPQNEQRNTQEIGQGRKRPAMKRKALEILKIKQKEAPTKVSVPEVEFAGDGHLEMSRALGFSLAKVEEVKAKVERGEILNEEESKYKEIDLKVVHEAVVSDFFEQAFTTGVFHTDLHQGNIFVDVNGDITEIDHGQVGREQSAKKRRALVEFVVGLSKNEPGLIAKAVSEFSPDIDLEAIQSLLTKQSTGDNNLLTATTKFISDNNIKGSINRFTKAMVNVYPYMQNIDEATLSNIMLPYIADATVIFDLERAIPGIVTEPMKEKGREVLLPVIDEVSRLDRIRQDPAAREALDAVLKTFAGGASIGADLAFLLGKGDTIMGRPAPQLLKSISAIVGLLSGGKPSNEIIAHMLTTGSGIGEGIAQLGGALGKLRERYRTEKATYQANKQEIDDALREFSIESPESENG